MRIIFIQSVALTHLHSKKKKKDLTSDIRHQHIDIKLQGVERLASQNVAEVDQINTNLCVILFN